MKKILSIALITVMLICSACGTQKDTRDIEYFKTAFEDAGYTLERVDEPAYAMINASDGILFYVDNKVCKIYRYKDEATIKKAKEESDFMSDWPQNGL